MANLLFVISTTTAAAELPAVSVGFLCPCRPCAKLQRSLADLHRAQAAPVPYAHSAATPAFLQAWHAPSVPTSRTAGAETFRLMMADSAATPSSSCSRTLWKSVSLVRQTNGVATHLVCRRGDRHRLGRQPPPRLYGGCHRLLHLLYLHSRRLRRQPHRRPPHPLGLRALGLHDHDRELVVDVGVDAKLLGLLVVSLPSVLPEPCISCSYHRLTRGLPLPSQTPPPRFPGPRPGCPCRWVPTLRVRQAAW